MSDFDKEAERERLREKYERDQQKRAESERMSDLLLKGATMTNGHCQNCGDPIFRYEGEEFCPTCQQVVTDEEAAETGATDGTDSTPDEAVGTDDGATADSPDAQAENATGSPDHIEMKEPTGPSVRTDADGEGSDPTQATSAANEPGSDDSGARSPNRSETRSPNRSETRSRHTEQSPSLAGGEPSPAPEPVEQPQSVDDDLAAARASLVRTLRAQAQRAENCDDPRRARDHLAAAREAAEALSALSSSY